MGNEPADPFSKACGLEGPLKVRFEGPGLQVASTIEFHRPFVVVGRDPLSDVRIDHADLSRRHAYFQVIDGRVFCVDLCSRTGVRWEEGPSPVGWVDRGRGVEVGPFRFQFEGEDEGRGGSLPVSRSFDWGSLPEARLEFLGAGSDREPWQISRALVLLGRSPICRVRLDGQGIGRIHAALVRTPAGIWVVDLHGPDGVLVGGAPARSSRLEDGDEFKLGGQRVLVRIGPGSRPSGRNELARRSTGQGVRPARPREADLPAAHVPAGGETPRPRLDLPENLDSSTVARLLGEFDRMHQRTTEQFQQAILMMFRMHQDQMEVVRDELARLDQLEEEQKALRAELARDTPPRSPRVALRLVSGETAPSPPLGERPGPSAAPSPGGPAAGEVAPSLSSPQAGGGISSPADPDPHARLSRRLAEIRDERHGLWKRLLGSLSGDGADRSLP